MFDIYGVGFTSNFHSKNCLQISKIIVKNTWNSIFVLQWNVLFTIIFFYSMFDLKSWCHTETCIHVHFFFLERVVKSLQRSKGGGRERGAVLKVTGEGERGLHIWVTDIPNLRLNGVTDYSYWYDEQVEENQNTEQLNIWAEWGSSCH